MGEGATNQTEGVSNQLYHLCPSDLTNRRWEHFKALYMVAQLDDPRFVRQVVVSNS